MTFWAQGSLSNHKWSFLNMKCATMLLSSTSKLSPHISHYSFFGSLSLLGVNTDDYTTIGVRHTWKKEKYISHSGGWSEKKFLKGVSRGYCLADIIMIIFPISKTVFYSLFNWFGKTSIFDDWGFSHPFPDHSTLLWVLSKYFLLMFFIRTVPASLRIV